MSAYNVQINNVAMVISDIDICSIQFVPYNLFLHFQNVELQTMATVVLRVVPVIQLIQPTVTTLTVIVHVRRDGIFMITAILQTNN
jgi:hypothetical protein